MSLKLFSPGKIVLWLNRQQFSESVALAVIAILVGLTSGIGVWLFKQLFNLIYMTAFGGLGTPLGLLHHKKIILQVFHDLVPWIEFGRTGSILGLVGNWTIYLVPVIGGLVVGLIAHFFIGKERYLGIAGIMESVALGGRAAAISKNTNQNSCCCIIYRFRRFSWSCRPFGANWCILRINVWSTLAPF